MEVGSEGRRSRRYPGVDISGFVLFPLPPPTAGAMTAYQVTGIMVKHFMWIILFNAHNNPIRKILLL